MSDVRQVAVVMRPLDQVKPYDNNPRRIPQDAIDAVATSIQMFGWQQPIVVDSEGVIVVGHTRRLAALQLGLTEVPVYVTDLSPEKVKEYRLVDNRTSELSGWDHNALVIELREFEQGLLDMFFADVNLEIEQVTAATSPTDNEMSWAEEKVGSVKGATDESLHTTEVVCPACFHTFAVRTRSLPGMDQNGMEELLSGGAE